MLEISLGADARGFIDLLGFGDVSEHIRRDDLLSLDAGRPFARALIATGSGQGGEAIASDLGEFLTGTERLQSGLANVIRVDLALGNAAEEMRGDDKMTTGHDENS